MTESDTPILVKISYGIGFGSHEDELEFRANATDEEIEEVVSDHVMERVSFGWERVSHD
ncbi:MAG: hypothetical protein AAGB23_05430 [Pseudomonadota bacterium]